MPLLFVVLDRDAVDNSRPVIRVLGDPNNGILPTGDHLLPSELKR
ncbi:MAG: hypothetical protein QOC76_1676 [Mycobacterium sp.]|nr:hypothetical protein [Mycobacterium sp.]